MNWILFTILKNSRIFFSDSEYTVVLGNLVEEVDDDSYEYDENTIYPRNGSLTSQWVKMLRFELKKLNKFMFGEHFKMENIRTAINIFCLRTHLFHLVRFENFNFEAPEEKTGENALIRDFEDKSFVKLGSLLNLRES